MQTVRLCYLTYEDTTYFGDEDGIWLPALSVEWTSSTERMTTGCNTSKRLEHFFAANGIDDADKKRAVLLTVVGAATYKTLRNIVSPKKPGEKTYSEKGD